MKKRKKQRNTSQEDRTPKCWQDVPALQHHGLRGSASPVLTATGLVNERWQYSTPYSINTP